jgi:ketosteroid isomerase-like protein
MGISANHYLVDAIIATSVCYKGFENLDGFNKYLGKTAPNLLLVIFGFGLIHGFGLSTRLQQLPLGESGLILRILSFNLGVELGQILALLGMVAIIAGWRRSQSFQRFTIYSNRGLIVAGALLFLMQIHNYGHSLNLEFFGMDSTSRSQVSFSSSSTSIALSKAMADYDQAFVERDVLALWDLFSEDIVLIEQGSQNVGRDDALGKHLGPDLKAFLQMAAEYKDVNVLEFDGAAIRTRHFIIQGKLPNRLFHARGFETQNWVIQSGKWKLVHMHWSFPVR